RFCAGRARAHCSRGEGDLDQVQHAFESLAYAVSLGLEASAVLLIMIGGLRAVVGLCRSTVGGPGFQVISRVVFLDLASWLLVALEFTLASDIVRSAIAPTWEEIGQLAAVAVIRTFLNYFLSRDLEQGGREFL